MYGNVYAILIPNSTSSMILHSVIMTTIIKSSSGNCLRKAVKAVRSQVILLFCCNCNSSGGKHRDPVLKMWTICEHDYTVLCKLYSPERSCSVRNTPPSCSLNVDSLPSWGRWWLARERSPPPDPRPAPPLYPVQHKHTYTFKCHKTTVMAT